MRITKNLRQDQEIILRFLDVFGGGSAALGSSNKLAQPGFFVFGSTFIQEYINTVFFRKEELLMEALDNSGLSTVTGATGGSKGGQDK